MKKGYKLLLITISSFVLFSCTDVVQVELDEGSKLYVIDAFITDIRTSPHIDISQSDNYFSNAQAPAVSNAIVVLKDLTDNKQYNFTYSSNGRYSYPLNVNSDTLAKVGHQYELNVTIDGDTYTALCTQKRTAVIDSISALYNPPSGGSIGPQEPFYTCFLWARDKVDQVADYYWIKTSRNDTMFSAPSDLNVCIDGTGGEVYDPSADTLDFTPPAIYLGFNEFQPGDKCDVEIHSITRETFNFLNQAVAQIQNGGLFATTPENVRTNIVTPSTAKVKAIGWFNMASVVTKTKVIPK